MWDQWSEDVTRCLTGCIKCQKSKADRYSKQTNLVPMPTGEHPFEERAMDFVRELPELQAFNVILVVTDWFTKVLLYILFKTTWTAKDIVNSYINDIWKLYALLKHLTSDRGSQFDSKFLKQLNRKLSFNLCLSTAYHLQTDRLRE